MSRCLLLFSLAAALVAPAWAQTPARVRTAAASLEESPSYWPLAVGNVWTYVETSSLRWFNPEPEQIRVVGEEMRNGANYFRVVEMFGREALLRGTSSGRIVEWVPEENVERVWYDFSLPVGGSWRPKNGEECTGPATVASRDATIKVPAGSYEDALTIDYAPGPCADAGVTDEAFAPGVGLLQRTITTIAGPRSFELREAQIGGKLLQTPGLSFGLSVNQTVYTPNLMPPTSPDQAVPTLEATIFVENSTSGSLILSFNSGQRFDLEIRDQSGAVVYRWSHGRVFTQALTTLNLSPGRKTFLVSAPLGDSENAEPFPAGRYLVEAWLTTSGEREYSATVPIEIQPAF